MTKHKTEDYKNSAVKYYLNNDKGDGYKRTCKIFDCEKDVVVCFGDYEQKQHMKFKEATKGERNANFV